MSVARSEDAREAAGPALANLRDVGGLRFEAGGFTAFGVLLRSDAPKVGDLSPPLELWPPATVVDLRSHGEKSDGPWKGTDATVHHLPMLAAANPEELVKESTEDFGELALLYQYMLDADIESLVRLTAIAAHAPGPILVHCAAGKDRTGVAVATLLRAAGVSRDEIVTDYLRTGANMRAVAPRLSATAIHALDNAGTRAGRLIGVDEVAINAVLDRIDDHRGGAAGWLVRAGAPAEDVATWTERIRG